MGDSIAEDKIERRTKLFLKKAWRAREQVERATNAVLGTKYAAVIKICWYLFAYSINCVVVA